MVRTARGVTVRDVHLRAPRYELGSLRYGPLDAKTVVQPRVAPQLFGAGLLEAVPQSAILEPVARDSTAGTVACIATENEDAGAASPIDSSGYESCPSLNPSQPNGANGAADFTQLRRLGFPRR